MIIDTHCHLDDSRYRGDLEQVLNRAEEAGVKKFIIPGANPETLKRGVALSRKYENIYYAVGVHPYDVDSYKIDFLKRFIDYEKCCGRLEECGLGLL